MKREVYKVTDWREGQARLDHYNAWLMDPKRPFDGTPYPGYPDKNDSYLEPTESVETVQDAPVSKGKKSNKINKLAHRKVTVALNPKVSHNSGTVTKHTQKGNQMAKVTNLSRAIEIVKALPGAPRSHLLDKLVEELSITRSNAFVYLTKATKALGAEATPKAEKAEKVAKAPAKARKVNPVTETSPEKAAAKVAEIDKVIAGLKANGAKVASPFAALGA